MRSRRFSDLQGLAAVVAACMLLCSQAAEAKWEKIKLADSPAVIEPEVTYASQAPAIDGVLDSCLQDLPIRQFTVVEKSDGSNPDVALSYRLAYGAQFLYVYIEVAADSLTYNDRAYQNGDGFALVLTHPAPGNAPTREFYVLACSAVNRSSMEWTRHVFWYYNVDKLFVPTSDDTKTAFRGGNGTISFELLLPWKDVHPYHPWLSDGIGFNLAMAKAVTGRGTNSYRAVDAEVGAENSPREYALLRFEKPHHAGGAQTFVRLDRNNIAEGDTLHARAVTVAAQPTAEELLVLTQTGEKTSIDYSQVSYECGPGLTSKDVVLKSYRQPAGGYLAKWESEATGSKGESGFSILPPFDAAALNRRLAGVRRRLSPGSLTTLEFTIEEIAAELKGLYPYETAAAQRIKIGRLMSYIEKAEAGTDQLASRREFVRLAYRSKLDNTLQPYVAWIPKDFDPSRKYPLLVFLHGSASTESDITSKNIIPQGFIAIGPRARGPSNFYSWDNAQTDIAEAVKSVKENYPIDERNVFLAGFSMGGYGVYRTYYESPATYKAIAVFSGMPKIGFDSAAHKDAKVVDFTLEENVKKFRNVPVFIFHGKRDMNVPYDVTERFVSQLERAGVSVEFQAEADKGHELPGDETVRAFFQWVDAVRQK